MVEQPHVRVAAGEPEHDVNESIVLDVDAGRALFESGKIERPLAALEQLVDVGRSGLGRQSERQVPERGEGAGIASFDAQPRLAPSLADLVKG